MKSHKYQTILLNLKSLGTNDCLIQLHIVHSANFWLKYLVDIVKPDSFEREKFHLKDAIID